MKKKKMKKTITDEYKTIPKNQDTFTPFLVSASNWIYDQDNVMYTVNCLLGVLLIQEYLIQHKNVDEVVNYLSSKENINQDIREKVIDLIRPMKQFLTSPEDNININ